MSIALIKAAWGERIYLAYRSQSQLKRGSQSRELQAGTEAAAVEEELLISLLQLTYSASFFIQPFAMPACTVCSGLYAHTPVRPI